MSQPETWGRIYALLHLVSPIPPDDLRRYAAAPWLYFPVLFQARLALVRQFPALESRMGFVLMSFGTSSQAKRAFAISISEQLVFYAYIFDELACPPKMHKKSGRQAVSG